MTERDWKREFDAAGAAGVRDGLKSGRWEKDKRAAAREWLERSDAMQWQSKRKGDGASGTTFDAFRRYRWIYMIGAAAFGLLGLAQALGKLF
jgi:hypothetical protein